jgi:hypothetical protein
MSRACGWPPQENTYSLNVNRKTLYIMQARPRQSGPHMHHTPKPAVLSPPSEAGPCSCIWPRPRFVSNRRGQPPPAPAGLQCTAEGDRPIELAFLENYGNIMKHAWFGEGYILLGFRNGYVVVVSSHSREINEEVHSGK